MSDLTAKFSTLEAEMTSIGDEAHSQRESGISSLEAINTAIASLDANISALRNQMLMAVRQNDPCSTCPPPSLITPVTSPTHHPINADKCKRVQAFINAIHQITGVFGAATDSGLFWSPSVVTSGISEVITTLVTGGTVPLPSFGEAINIAGDAINYGLSNIGRGDNLQSQFDSISSGMQASLFDTTNPAAVQATYAGIVDASSLPGDEKSLFKALGYNDLFSYFFDPSSTPDLTPYDGSICSVGLCYVFSTAEMIHVDGEFGGGWIPDWSKYGLTNVSLPGQDNPVWVYRGWGSDSWDNTGYDDVYHQMQAFPTGNFDETGTFPSFPGDNWGTVVRSAGPFAITICPDT